MHEDVNAAWKTGGLNFRDPADFCRFACLIEMSKIPRPTTFADVKNLGVPRVNAGANVMVEFRGHFGPDARLCGVARHDIKMDLPVQDFLVFHPVRGAVGCSHR